MSKFLKLNWILISLLTFATCSNDDSIKVEPSTVLPVTGKPYTIVDTGIIDFYSNTSKISTPASTQIYYGQDATYIGNQPSYTNNGDGTVTDNITGLQWEKDMGTKITFDEAF